MQVQDNERQFQTDFQNSFSLIGNQMAAKYKPVLQYYQKIIIPFQKKRLLQNQSLVFQNSTLQKDKMDLISKIEKLSSENQRHEQVLQRQQIKIHELQRKRDSLLKLKAQNQILIDELTKKIGEMEQSLNMKVQTIKIVQKDKASVLEKYQQRNNDYNILLANYMKDKNMLAEKLNQMNQLQENVLQKEKDLKAQQFYLKKMWEQFQQAKKNQDKQKLKQKQSPTSKSNPRIPYEKQKLPTRNQGQIAQDQDENISKTQKNKLKQIVRTPLKKLFKYHQSQIYHLSFNYNGSMLSSCGGDRQVKLYDIMNLRNVVTIQSNSVENIFQCAVLNYGGERLLTGGTDKNLTIFNSHNGKALHSFLGHGEKINSVAWSCVKQKCISGSEDKQIKIWEIQKASNLLSISCGKAVKFLTANSVEPVVYSGHTDGSVRVYSINQGKTPISQIKGLIDYPINSISLLSNRYQFLVSTLEGTTIYLMDMKMNKAVKKYEHKDFFNTAVQADISPSQNYIVAGNCDGYLYYWSRQKAQMQKKVSAHQCPVTTVKYNFMSGTLATADKQGSLIIWQ